MKILKDSAIYIIGEIASKLMPFLLIPYLSGKLGVEGYGLLSYYQTYMVLFALIIGLSQDGAVARYFYVYGKRSINLVVNTGYAYATVMGCIIFIICWLLHSEALMYISLAVIFQIFMGVQLSVRQCQKQALSYTIVQFLFAVIPVIVTVLLFELYETELVEKRFLAILLGNIIVFCLAYILYKNKINIVKKFSFKQYKIAFYYFMGFGLPLIFHHGSFFIKGQLDRFFIYHKYSEGELGIYAMGANLALVVSTLVLAVNKAVIPYYFEALKNNKLTLTNIYKFTFISFLIIPFAFFILCLIPEDLFLWVLGDKFIGVKYYFTLFTISTLFIIPYLFMVNYLFFYGKTKLIAFCSVFSTVLYLIALIILINTEVKYIPYASIVGALGVLPVLYLITKKVRKEVE
ncbi:MULTISPECIES: oligosaccharide flippase family protein [Pasteurellaceae]|uniref:Oligosaccharide flippase family protein n=1 Tax=Pasteurella atlantica TaxID=2827233 RepID=A0AAW8CQ54_9PAST|nr:oligosaccharide flippase family protein [Pasteurella atlantica]MBR0574437.1 oligosaccharide flippase family protein [Pasteurella atlantica]MDP8040324.1 oligosaccharide flippase family protein [Pasteurella atlantica]MDP8042492.1 oligosaccharide flippase family protein [Pasteurella atlantica]MDP8044594.1 oligosaccharide flippase family protein [Pasteurella atlantica]MDP8046659.1 oligosaccharide flippase family protein [Pasteurella atlantica]